MAGADPHPVRRRICLPGYLRLGGGSRHHVCPSLLQVSSAGEGASSVQLDVLEQRLEEKLMKYQTEMEVAMKNNLEKSRLDLHAVSYSE